MAAQTLGEHLSNAPIQSAAQADLSSQTVSTSVILGITVALGGSTQTAIDNIVNDMNALKAKLRTAGLLAP